MSPGAGARLQLLRRVALDVEHHLQRDGDHAGAEAGQLARDGGCLLGDGEQELERQVARRVLELDLVRVRVRGSGQGEGEGEGEGAGAGEGPGPGPG